MDAEHDQLTRLGTYVLVPCPPNRKPVGCRWVYDQKRDHTGAIVKHKARLVAQGYSQKKGVDYNETFSPVVRLESLRAVIAIATALDLDLHSMDVVGAYLNGKLDEEIYMKQPPGYEDGTDRVCKLRLGLYGLKQAGRGWYKKMKEELAKLGYTPLASEPCIYARQRGTQTATIAVHVDDMGLSSTPGDMAVIKKELGETFKSTDLGELKLIVGLEVDRNRAAGTLRLSQKHYLERVLERFGMADSHPVYTPLDPNVKLVKREASDPHSITAEEAKLTRLYQAAIGSLMYAALGTRPDLAFTVQHLSQFCSAPSPAHWTAVKRVMRYIKATLNVGLTYGPAWSPEDFQLVAYSDADWAGTK